MRVLAIRQPWASLIAEGHKTIEVRSRNTNIRETIAIYASRTKPFTHEIIDADIGYNLSTGKIIAIADLVDCDECRGETEFRLSKDKHKCPVRYYIPGKTFYWCLDDVRKITPIDFKATSIVWSNVDDELIRGI